MANQIPAAQTPVTSPPATKNSGDRLDQLVSSGQVTQYVQDSGKFSYDSKYNIVIITGNKVRLRSQPNTDSRIIDSANMDEVVLYHGEWTNPQGEKWILGQDYDYDSGPGEFVWGLRRVHGTWLS